MMGNTKQIMMTVAAMASGTGGIEVGVELEWNSAKFKWVGKNCENYGDWERQACNSAAMACYDNPGYWGRGRRIKCLSDAYAIANPCDANADVANNFGLSKICAVAENTCSDSYSGWEKKDCVDKCVTWWWYWEGDCEYAVQEAMMQSYNPTGCGEYELHHNYVEWWGNDGQYFSFTFSDDDWHEGYWDVYWSTEWATAEYENIWNVGQWSGAYGVWDNDGVYDVTNWANDVANAEWDGAVGYWCCQHMAEADWWYDGEENECWVL